MSLVLDKPLIFFDLETTGINVEKDRIIQIALVRVDINGVTEEFDCFLNPEMPIDSDAIAVHGIKDEQLVGKPTFATLAPSLWSIFEGSDLCGFNIERFDIPLLVNEFKRAGYEDFMQGRKVIDVMTIYHKNEKRDLPSAVRFYLKRDHYGAHNALEDVKATSDILKTQIDYYSLGSSPTVTRLHDYCHEKPKEYVDDEGKFIWRGDNAVISFGKHLGRTLQDMSQNDAGYLQWILKGNFADKTKEIAHNALNGSYPTRSV